MESSSDALVSSEPPSNSDIDVSNAVEAGDDLLDSKTGTLTMEPSSDHDHDGAGDIDVSNVVEIGDDLLESKTETLTMQAGDIVVQDSVDGARVPGDGIGIVMENVEKALDELSSDVVVSSVPPGNSDIDVSNEVEVEVGVDLLDSKTETLTMEPSSDHDGAGDITVQNSIDVSKGVEIGDDLLDSKTGTLTMQPSSDHDGSGDIIVQDSIDGAGDIDESNVLEVEDDLLDSKTETLTSEQSTDRDGAGDIAVQNSVDDARVPAIEIITENVEKVSDELSSDAVVSSIPPSNSDIAVINGVKLGDDLLESETGTLNHDVGGGICVQDSTDEATARVSGDEKEIVMENVEKILDENMVNDEEKEGVYKVTDLVWAKVKSYPWWPGQIFDPSASTDKAKKHSNKKAFLVAYFGDQTFAWNQALKLKPFRKNFNKMEKQSNSKGFCNAVNCALDEVSRRLEFGLACSCLSKDVYDKIKSQVFVNAGIKKEDRIIEGGDNFSTVATFNSVNIVQSVQDLAKEHFDEFSRLEVLSVKTQLLAFFRWKGYYQLSAQQFLYGLDDKLEDDSELPLMEEDKMVEDSKPVSVGDKVSSKKRKSISRVTRDTDDSDSDSVPKKKEKRSKNTTRKRKSSGKRKSKENIDKKATVDEKSTISSPKKLFRVGDSICRIAKQLSESPSIPKKESHKLKNDEEI